MTKGVYLKCDICDNGTGVWDNETELAARKWMKVEIPKWSSYDKELQTETLDVCSPTCGIEAFERAEVILHRFEVWTNARAVEKVLLNDLEEHANEWGRSTRFSSVDDLREFLNKRLLAYGDTPFEIDHDPADHVFHFREDGEPRFFVSYEIVSNINETYCNYFIRKVDTYDH